MSSSIPESITGVTATTKANIYFDGKVVSHSLEQADGSKVTLGLIYPGTYHFGTGKPEKMEVVAGACDVVLDGSTDRNAYKAGDTFHIPGNSGFDITVAEGICEYICTFLEE
jgi:uncharacterized protein YaiE (UPF0345 family)